MRIRLLVRKLLRRGNWRCTFPIITSFLLICFLFSWLFSEPAELYEYLLVTTPNQGGQARSQSQSNVPIPPAIVLELGHRYGIGNQLFTFACAYTLARNIGLNFWIYTHKLTSHDPDPTDSIQHGYKSRNFALSYFDINFTRMTSDETSASLLQFESVFRRINNLEILAYVDPDGARDLAKSFETYNSILLKVEGSCESEIYFQQYRDELKQHFSFRPEAIASILRTEEQRELHAEIKLSESVGLHMRFQDFRTTSYRRIPIPYYKRAIKRISKEVKNPKFFIFSDDIELAWVKLIEFEVKGEIVYVSRMTTSSLQDFFLMKACKHNIIASSTFSWWAAYLNTNPNKVIVAPRQKFGKDYYTKKSIRDRIIQKYFHQVYSYPSNWLTVNSFVDHD